MSEEYYGWAGIYLFPPTSSSRTALARRQSCGYAFLLTSSLLLSAKNVAYVLVFCGLHSAEKRKVLSEASLNPQSHLAGLLSLPSLFPVREKEHRRVGIDRFPYTKKPRNTPRPVWFILCFRVLFSVFPSSPQGTAAPGRKPCPPRQTLRRCPPSRQVCGSSCPVPPWLWR